MQWPCRYIIAQLQQQEARCVRPMRIGSNRIGTKADIACTTGFLHRRPSKIDDADVLEVAALWVILVVLEKSVMHDHDLEHNKEPHEGHYLEYPWDRKVCTLLTLL